MCQSGAISRRQVSKPSGPQRSRARVGVAGVAGAWYYYSMAAVTAG
jgi:hypothetical protein